MSMVMVMIWFMIPFCDGLVCHDDLHQNSAGDSWWSFRRTLRPRLPRFLREKPPHANPSFLKYHPNKKTKKTSNNNDQQKTQQFRKAKGFFSRTSFFSHPFLNLCGFPRFFGSTTKRDMSARANWFTATISIRRVSPLSSKTSQVRISQNHPTTKVGAGWSSYKWGY